MAITAHNPGIEGVMRTAFPQVVRATNRLQSNLLHLRLPLLQHARHAIVSLPRHRLLRHLWRLFRCIVRLPLLRAAQLSLHTSGHVLRLILRRLLQQLAAVRVFRHHLLHPRAAGR